MAEEKSEAREGAWRQLFPWTELFRCFKVAVDPNKLLLAGAGILIMSVGWWLLAWVFSVGWTEPQIGASKYNKAGEVDWATFKHDCQSYSLMNQTAGLDDRKSLCDVIDLVENRAEYANLEAVKKRTGGLPEDALVAAGIPSEKAHLLAQRYQQGHPYAVLATLPWKEQRGPNPYLMVTGQARGTLWEPGHFWNWLAREQMPVLLEPLIKIVQPIIYFFSPRSTAYTRFYFLMVTLWTIFTWSIFGGAITRIAAVEVTRGEKIGLGEALRFTTRRWLSYLAAPLFPLLFVLFLLVLSAIYGLFFMIPIVGELFVAGIFWWVPLLLGLAMACTLVGLAVGWPLMAPTISAEGTDSWEAVSRSFTYVFQRPWHYIWYALVGLTYGAIAMFFIGFMGSFTVYLAKWGVNSVQPSVRDASFLFVYSPTSFGWRPLLLQGATIDGQSVVVDGVVQYGTPDKPGPYEKYVETLYWWNQTGAWLVAIWLGILFLMIVGFGYSFFWSMSTIIYLLMRRHVDTAEMDEVYLEEEEEMTPGGFPVPPPAPPAPPSPAKQTGPALTMLDPPTLRTPPPSQAPAPATPPVSSSVSPPASTTSLPVLPTLPLDPESSSTATATQPGPLPSVTEAPEKKSETEEP